MAAKKKVKKSKSAMSKSSAKLKVAKKAATRKKGTAAREHGPAEWFLPTVEGTYTKLMPRALESAASPAKGATRALASATAAPVFRAVPQSVRAQEVPEVADRSLWRDRLSEYKKRKATAVARPLARLATRIAPAAPPANQVLGFDDLAVRELSGTELRRADPSYRGVGKS